MEDFIVTDVEENKLKGILTVDGVSELEPMIWVYSLRPLCDPCKKIHIYPRN